MEKFTTLTSIAAPLMLENVDTDVITPMELMVTYGFGKTVGRIAFAPLRYIKDENDGPDFILHQPKENPEFVLNQEPFRQAQILLAGTNFGCGSSREMAVWAIARMGYRCLIAPSFGEIFFNNCFKNGVLPIVLPREVVEDFAEIARSGGDDTQFTVDLNTCEITSPSGEKIAFAVEATRRESLLEGLDEIGMTLQRESEIADFQQRDRQERPWVYLSRTAEN
jgi:3-isopropylmalate/(R)-2-methylmalate dehydratase small subunit